MANSPFLSDHGDVSRRSFLQASAAVGSWSVALSFDSLLQRAAVAAERRTVGPLQPVADETTGLELLKLPAGFRYLSYGWKGDLMSDGVPTPGAHDGIGVIHETDGIVTLVRNHEQDSDTGAFRPQGNPYDAKASGGCTNLTFDTKAGKWVKAWSSLVGTARNCAGGVTPWGTWLSCEETVYGPGDKDEKDKTKTYNFTQDHGYIFEVPRTEASTPQPLKAMGRFVHEAVAIDPVSGYVYETEDRTNAGFYRFIPKQLGQLAMGGKLQMMKVSDFPELRKDVPADRWLPVTWVDIEDPTRAHSPGKQDSQGVFLQGKAQQGTTFARLEGCWYGNKSIYVVSTSGGNVKAGQIFLYDPARDAIKLIFESPSADILDAPDNVCVSPRGGIVLCEDGNREPQKLQGLTSAGQLFELAANNVVLKPGDYKSFKAGDYRKDEWCGATFSPDGRWLFANLQSPGFTVAITGPWEDLGL
ncbi:MAG: putative phosphatase [Planctomycetaceae bacterium]|nr:putative phosphatase [Planctomycetaceae bacterium]